MIAPDSFWMPRPYDKNGNPIPGGRIVTDPLFTKDMDIAREFAGCIKENPGADMKPLKPWIWVSNSIAAMETVEQLRKFFDDRRERKNTELRAKIAGLHELLRAQKFDAQTVNAELTGLLLHVGAEVSEDGKIVFPTDTGRYSDSAIAGRYDIARGRRKKNWSSPLVSFLAVAGSGTLMCLGLGVLTGQLDLNNLQPVPTGFCGFIGVSLAACTSAGIKPSFFKNGQIGFFHGFSGKFKWLTPVSMVSLATATVMLVVAIQSKVEQLGIFKGLNEDSSLKGVTLSQSDLFLVSLIMVVMVMVYYVWASFTDGYEFAAGDKIESLRTAAIQEALASEEGKRLTELIDQIAPVKERIAALEEEVAVIQLEIADDYTDAERKQLDETSKACIDYSNKAEEACGFRELPTIETGEPWWERILPRRS